MKHKIYSILLIQLEGITPGHCNKIIATYEPIEENRLHGVLGIDGKIVFGSITIVT